jgi:hypothetical protein
MRASLATLFGLIAAGAMTSAAAAEPTPGECLIEVGGIARLDGPCLLERRADKELVVWLKAKPDAPPVAKVEPTEWSAAGSWRDPSGASPALTPLGEGWELGGCWHGENAVLCAWPEGARPAPLPAEYQGVWAIESEGSNGCGEGSDIRTDVTPLLVQQYESACAPVSSAPASAGLQMVMTCKGEGMTWTSKELWRMDGGFWIRTTVGTTDFKDYDGTTLPDDEEEYTARLERCPGEKP